ncbi:MAG: hypothetical protein LKF01_00305 [Lactobacillus sp.]|jgi:protein subunit release factor A|nr:hypothetical protein [Lactobacillus sp.]MCH4067985.1 hypothetical protein [Lactobacillus sp.]MCI1304059.1 hypothetical protein [Lactobacillus sp.]MCI1329915.1 hypothetical protein [Lactobacillus sp.]MCI1399515.1 hypothetical protein [Lactobacillus sp.]
MRKPKTRKEYLINFAEQNDLSKIYQNHETIQKTGEKIIEALQKEGLTYTEAYASLQYAYNKLKFESNFVTIPKEKNDGH